MAERVPPYKVFWEVGLNRLNPAFAGIESKLLHIFQVYIQYC